jgi:hypothetical protein
MRPQAAVVVAVVVVLVAVVLVVEARPTTARVLVRVEARQTS